MDLLIINYQGAPGGVGGLGGNKERGGWAGSSYSSGKNRNSRFWHVVRPQKIVKNQDEILIWFPKSQVYPTRKAYSSPCG